MLHWLLVYLFNICLTQLIQINTYLLISHLRWITMVASSAICTHCLSEVCLVGRSWNFLSAHVFFAHMLLNPLLKGLESIKHPVPDRVKPSFVFFDIRALWRPAPSVRMSKITNDGLTLFGTGFFIAVTHTATVGVKWLISMKYVL